MLSGIKDSLILGKGEVGISLYNILNDKYNCIILDKDETERVKPDILHICFPYSSEFIRYVKLYIDNYKPKVTVIHSTVPVGTTDQCGKKVFHSPVRGKHPNLEKGLRTFPKHIAGSPSRLGRKIEYYFKEAGIPAIFRGQPAKNTELAKIMSTTYYGWNIVFCKEMARICKNYGVDFGLAYTIWNQEYNDGYRSFGDERFVRPVLEPTPGKIGGHCVVQNCGLEVNEITKIIRELNQSYD